MLRLWKVFFIGMQFKSTQTNSHGRKNHLTVCSVVRVSNSLRNLKHMRGLTLAKSLLDAYTVLNLSHNMVT